MNSSVIIFFVGFDVGGIGVYGMMYRLASDLSKYFGEGGGCFTKDSGKS